MKLLFISIEFSASTFSGNGIYAQSQVRALSRLGHEVLVICGKPENHSEARRLEGAVDLLEVELPVWGRLDAQCAWRQFAAGASRTSVCQAVATFAPEAVLGVDWHSLAAYDSLEEALAGSGVLQLAPYVFMNYRVHLRTATGEDRELLSGLERRALQRSACTTVLSRSDAQYLADAFPDVAPKKALHVLLPALRSDMEHLAMPADLAAHPCCSGGDGSAAEAEAAVLEPAAPAQLPISSPPRPLQGVVDPGRGRYLLTCAVRISPEKEPHRFLELACELARRGALERCGMVPLMFGAGWESDYGQELRARVQCELPECLVLDTFMGPADLAAIYAATRLNVHPCLYDAYGMTVVEAASQGAPSLVNEGGHVGATDLLDATAGEVFCVDLSHSISQLATQVEALLGDPGPLRSMGAAAACKARSWSEEANAATLVGMVQEALQAQTSA